MTLRVPRKIWLFLLATAVIVAIAGIFKDDLLAQGLESYAIPANDLPSGARVLSQGYVTLDDGNHPLNRETLQNITADTQLFEMAYARNALLQRHGVGVGQYLYQYATASDAEQMAKLFYRQIHHEYPILTEQTYPAIQPGAWEGLSFSLISPAEGEFVFWYVGTQDDMLSLIVVDGFDEHVTQAILDEVVKEFQNR